MFSAWATAAPTIPMVVCAVRIGQLSRANAGHFMLSATELYVDLS